MPDLKKGDRVAYTAKFLRSIGDYTNHFRGEVEDIQKYGGINLATVLGDDGERHTINATNLIREDLLHLEPV